MVTGGTRGIGRAIALRLLREGARRIYQRGGAEGESDQRHGQKEFLESRHGNISSLV